MKPFTYKNKTVLVSEDGKIYFNDKPLCVVDNGRGYLATTIQYKKMYVHRVVLEAFHGPSPRPNMDCNHINGIKSDNRPENLEWCTRSFNVLHSYRVLNRKPSCNQLGKSGYLHHNSNAIMSVKDVSIIEHGSLRECAKYHGITHQTIRKYSSLQIPYNGVLFCRL